SSPGGWGFIQRARVPGTSGYALPFGILVLQCTLPAIWDGTAFRSTGRAYGAWKSISADFVYLLSALAPVAAHMNSQPMRAAESDRSIPLLRLKRGEERRLAAGHLWVFSNEIDTGSAPLSGFAPGAVAELRTYRDAFIGYACVNPHALICARILSRDAARPIDRALLQQRLTTALALRERLGGAPYYRWVFGESDQLPGLVLDRYGDVIVGQIATAGMEALQAQVSAAVRAVLDPAVLFWKNNSAARELEHLPQLAQAAFGEVPETIEVIEGALSFSAPLAAGQKTGWFYDQTGNRARLARYLRPGARMLDVCSYAGAWAGTALRQGAGSAVCVDASQAALDFAQRNAQRNGGRIAVVHEDAFEALKVLLAQGARFDVV